MNISKELLKMRNMIDRIIEAYQNNLREEEVFANIIAGYFGFNSYKELISNKKEPGNRENVKIWALKWSCLFMKECYKISYTRLGLMYNRDHATIIHHCNDLADIIRLGRDHEINKIYHELIIILSNMGYNMYTVKKAVVNWTGEDYGRELNIPTEVSVSAH